MSREILSRASVWWNSQRAPKTYYNLQLTGDVVRFKARLTLHLGVNQTLASKQGCLTAALLQGTQPET